MDPNQNPQESLPPEPQSEPPSPPQPEPEVQPQPEYQPEPMMQQAPPMESMQPMAPAPTGSDSSKKIIIIIVSVVAGIAALVGGFFLVRSLFSGGTLTCEGKHSTFGVDINEQYVFRFRGGSLDTTDWVQTSRLSSSLIDIDDILDAVKDEIPSGMNANVRTSGSDTIIVEAKNLGQDQLRHTGLYGLSTGSIGRNAMKEFMEDVSDWDFTCR